MINFIECLGMALLISGGLAALSHLLLAQVKGAAMNVFHLIGLAVLFLFLLFQAYCLVDAWQERSAIVDLIETGNSWYDEALDFVDALDKRNGGSGDASQKIRDAFSDPLVQQGLHLFGLDTVATSDGMSLDMLESLKTSYNWYMFRRVLWMLGGMAVFAGLGCLFGEGGGRRRSSYSQNMDTAGWADL